MPQRMSALDASFLYMETASTPMHVGTVSIFARPEGGFDHEQLVRLIRSRLAYVPRYRKRLKQVPFGIARPVWVDDVDFDVTYHVRRSALPRPGTREQLEELVGRLMGRPLDPMRPLWEMTLVEGLADDAFAIVTKSHEALIDGLAAMDISQAILDTSADAKAGSVDAWLPAREPSSAELLSEAVTQLATSPAIALDAARSTIGGIASGVSGAVGGVASSIASRARDVAIAALGMPRATADLPMNVPIGQQRRFAMVDLPLDELKAVRAKRGGSVNDVVLAVVTGAVREWLLSRGHPLTAGETLRAVVPISTGAAQPGASAQVSAFLLDLPIGEPRATVRFDRITFQTARLKDSAQLLGADAILGIAGFAPPTLHALGARLASRLSSRVYNLAITNVPGPQEPRFASGARLVASYPVMPLAAYQALSVGLTSYDGTVFVGINADRDAVRDLPVLSGALALSLAELSDGRHLRPIAAS